MTNLRPIKDVKTEDLKGKRVLLRLDLNVPINAGVVANGFRLEKARPTIDYLLKTGAKILILSHLSQGEAGASGGGSLRPVADYYRQYGPMGFIESLEAANGWEHRPEPASLLENLRHWSGEENNDPVFAASLAALGDLYVNEAFSVSHRAHASVVGLPALLPSYAGLNFMAEVESLSLVLEPEKPLLVILGGAKFKTKLPLVTKFLPIADKIFLGGALASTWLKAGGYEVGVSVVDDDRSLLRPLLNQKKIIVPSDVIIKTGAGEIEKVAALAVPADAKIVDVGPEAIRRLSEEISEAKTVLWNGPLGYFEGGFSTATDELAEILVRHTRAGLQTIIGGGDTVTAIEKLNLMDQFTFVSTAGGAMLDFLAEGTLPGLRALETSQEKFHLG